MSQGVAGIGLLLLAKPDKKRFLVEPVSGLSMVPIQLELQLEDVKNAVESELYWTQASIIGWLGAYCKFISGLVIHVRFECTYQLYMQTIR